MLNNLTYNELAAECHANNAKWWHDIETGERLDRNKGQLLMLVVSELAEAMEGFRKDLRDDKLPHRKMAEVELVDAVIRIADFAGGFGLDLDRHVNDVREAVPLWANSFPTEPAERLLWIVMEVDDAYTEFSSGNDENGTIKLTLALTMIEFMAAMHSFDLDGAYTEKTEFNKVRPDHKAEARLAAGGKKF